ncbi:hypothetical protein AK95_14640 [Paenibacillus sp. LC231]|uniref:helix-turn-helix domain-containing protein n=1 Tax=unclassified Paenibacillus TaxID=185978 RepID=UPI0008DC84F6|nr:helix-turn-helix transcriptional regulator [Paenibacillus sp. LC231]OIB04850.1 hypothetical protein AK95_14640 [Paenibacillus sp. LC231]
MTISVFGNYIRSLRKSRSLTLTDLAGLSGVHAAHISRIETGGREVPKPETIKRLSEALKVPYDELMIAAGYLDKNWVGKDLNRHVVYEFTLLKVENACLREEISLLKEAKYS